MQLLSILFFGLSQYQSEAVRKPPKLRCIWLKVEGGPFCFFYFFAAGFGIIFGFLVLCFPASLLFCFSACLLLCLSASLLYLLLFFSASLLSLLLCFSAFVLLCLSTSTILLFLFFSHVFLLLYFLLLCFSASCLYSLFVFSFLLLYSLLFVNTLGETQRNLKEILIRTPDKKPYMKP